ncbi:hypothetical protein B0T14DRAFT_602910 [Immersiella caudata]|uniref:Peptidase M3A/M3B catalytic domain-containing protein n=1 Tax=Immersiella caudata TaxID=314043 RepID=A0AA40BZ98_9PEZI|nr:hypothetical protein B0T14DRAFT_602910 [Immersiella caudata]
MAARKAHHPPYRVPTPDEIPGIVANIIQKYRAMQDNIAKTPLHEISFENLVILWARVENEESVHMSIFVAMRNERFCPGSGPWVAVADKALTAYHQVWDAAYPRRDLSARLYTAKQLMDIGNKLSQGAYGSASKWEPWKAWMTFHINESEVRNNRPHWATSEKAVPRKTSPKIMECQQNLHSLRSTYTEMLQKPNSEAGLGGTYFTEREPVGVLRNVVLASLTTDTPGTEARKNGKMFASHKLGHVVLANARNPGTRRKMWTSMATPLAELAPICKDTIYQQKLEREVIKFNKDQVGSLLAVRIIKVDPQTVDSQCYWHEEVEIHEVYRKQPDGVNEFLGHVYLDLFQRQGKPSGAPQMIPLYPGYRMPDGSRGAAASVVEMGLAPGLGMLISSLFRLGFYSMVELGHALHYLLIENTYAGGSRWRSRFDFPYDFIEVPSHVMENILDQTDITRRSIC